jgi:uncharacterized protein (DUF1697 family)
MKNQKSKIIIRRKDKFNELSKPEEEEEEKQRKIRYEFNKLAEDLDNWMKILEKIKKKEI